MKYVLMLFKCRLSYVCIIITITIVFSGIAKLKRFIPPAGVCFFTVPGGNNRSVSSNTYISIHVQLYIIGAHNKKCLTLNTASEPALL